MNQYSVNGVSLSCEDINDIWVDECFKRMRIPAHTLQTGRNEVMIRVHFKRTTNVEALYLIGNFGVHIQGRQRTLTSLPDRIGCDNLEIYGLPFFTGGVTYYLQADAYKELTEDADRVLLSPLGWNGGCVKVGETVLGWEPYEADITEVCRAGQPVGVTVIGTRRNVFGPLHQIPKLAASYGPANFVTEGKEWTDEYSLLDSGLRGICLKGVKDDL